MIKVPENVHPLRLINQLLESEDYAENKLAFISFLKRRSQIAFLWNLPEFQDWYFPSPNKTDFSFEPSQLAYVNVYDKGT